MIDPRLNDRGLTELERRFAAAHAGLIPADHPQLWTDSALLEAAGLHRAFGIAAPAPIIEEVRAHDCDENAVPYTRSGGALGHGWECGVCGAFLQAG